MVAPSFSSQSTARMPNGRVLQEGFTHLAQRPVSAGGKKVASVKAFLAPLDETAKKTRVNKTKHKQKRLSPYLEKQMGRSRTKTLTTSPSVTSIDPRKWGLHILSAQHAFDRLLQVT